MPGDDFEAGEPLRARPVRGLALVALIALGAFLTAMPLTALTKAAEPVTVGEWLRTIFVTPDREVDQSQLSTAAPGPPPPPPALVQTSSEQIPPAPNPTVRRQLPEGWVRDPDARRRKRRALVV